MKISACFGIATTTLSTKMPENEGSEIPRKYSYVPLVCICERRFELIGFGKSFHDKSHLDDLLSIPDFAAGVVQDLLQAHRIGEDNVPGGEEKKALMKWIATQEKFLSKITIQISRLPDGELGSGLVAITPVEDTL